MFVSGVRVFGAEVTGFWATVLEAFRLWISRKHRAAGRKENAPRGEARDQVPEGLHQGKLASMRNL